MSTFRRVLLPTDQSTHALQARQWAFDTLDGVEHFFLLYVSPPPEVDRMGDADRRDEVLVDLQNQIRKSDSHQVETTAHVLTGHPPSEICRFAEQHQCDVIVMATRGLTGLKHLLLGSTTERVVRHSSVPVLTLRLT